MIFRSLLKILRKGAYVYLFILSAIIERRRKQVSYCDYIRISQIEIYILFARSDKASEFKNKRKILLTLLGIND